MTSLTGLLGEWGPLGFETTGQEAVPIRVRGALVQTRQEITNDDWNHQILQRYSSTCYTSVLLVGVSQMTEQQ